jgi:hypothetical protein
MIPIESIFYPITGSGPESGFSIPVTLPENKVKSVAHVASNRPSLISTTRPMTLSDLKPSVILKSYAGTVTPTYIPAPASDKDSCTKLVSMLSTVTAAQPLTVVPERIGG